MEDGTWEHTDCCSCKKHKNRPSWNLVRIWSMFVQFHILEVLRIEWILQVFYSCLELRHPSSINFRIKLRDKHRGYFFLELYLCSFEFDHICLKCALKVALKSFNLALQQVLEMMRALLKLICKFLVILDDSLFEFFNLILCPLSEGIIFSD